MGFHAASNVNGVSPQILEELCDANDTRSDWSGVDANPELERFTRLVAYFYHFGLHVQRHLCDRVYEKGRYYLAIDDTQPPQPPLSEEDIERMI